MTTKRVGRGRLVPLGPFGDHLPARFEGEVENYAGRPLRVTVSLSYDGTDRVKLDSVTVARTDGASITAQDMARLQIAAVVRSVIGSVVWDATVHGPGVVLGFDPRREHDGRPTDDELQVLARMYWQEYVGWGQPRQAVRDAFNLPRSTANRWIRKARDRYGLPGPHSGEVD